MREFLAWYAHDAWSRWMRHLFTRGILNDDGTFTISKFSVDRWRRQMETDYKDLSEGEKESDCQEAIKILQITEGAIR